VQEQGGLPAARGEGEESAGGTRVAMSDNGTVRYFITDHLGSTTRLINADGTEYSETDYLSWGYDGLTPLAMGTSFKYTGQRQAEAGLYFYNARWYDPELGRFIQADSIIPEPGNPLAWDRYSYGFNNPVNSIDPTGHSPFWALNLFASIYIGYEINAAMGVSPDYVGIVRANIAMNSTGSIEVAAGLAVQGQFSGKIDDVIGDIWPGDSGYGLAQTNPDQTEAMSLGRLDPHDPSVAILVMQTRIENAQAACQNCNSMDLFMIGALAQNNYLDNDGVNGLTRNSNGDID
jgi:RHS repeat-associated protein